MTAAIPTSTAPAEAGAAQTAVLSGPDLQPVIERRPPGRSRRIRRAASPTDDSADASSLDYRDLEPLLIRLAALDADDPARDWLVRRIISACLPLAKHIAQRFSGRGESFEDLEQVARIGLINAVKRYDPSHGSTFMSFAVPTMMGEVRRHFRDRSWTVYVPRAAKENWLRVGPATEDLTTKLGRAPTTNELGAELGLSADAVTEALLAGYAHSPESIDVPTGDSEEARPLVNQLAVEEAGYEYIDEWLSVKPLIEALPTMERAVLKMRFFNNMTQSQIATKIGRSQMHVSRMLAHTLATLRDQAT